MSNTQPKSIQKNIIYNLMKTVAIYAFPLFSFMYAARVLGVEGIGNVDFSKNYVFFFIMLSQFGLDLYGVREVARVRDNKEKLCLLVQELLTINIITACFAYVLLLISIFLFKFLLLEHMEVLLIFSAGIIFTGIGAEWLLVALEEYRYIAVRTIFCQILSVGLLLILVKDRTDILKYTAICTFSSYGPPVLNIFFVRKTVQLKLNFSGIKRHFEPLIWFLIMNLSISLYTLLDTTMLGIIKNDYEVGLYAAAIKLNKVLNSFISAIGVVFLPRLSYYMGTDKKAVFKKTIAKLTKMVSFFSVPLFVGCVFYRKLIIQFFCGKQYEEANDACGVLAFLLVVLPVSVMINKQILIPSKNEKKVIVSTFCGAIVNITLNAVLIPDLGHLGAAYATIIAELVVTAVCMFMVRQVLDIPQVLREYKNNLVAIIPASLIYFFMTYAGVSLWINMLFTIVLGGAGYLTLSILLKNEIADIMLKNIELHLLICFRKGDKR